MNLIINYDFFNAIKDVNEPISPYKVMRNNKKFNAFVALPWFLIYNLFQYKDNLMYILLNLPIEFGVLTSLETVENALFHKDKYKDRAMNRLKELVGELNNLNLDTDYDLLLNSQMYKRKYELHLNKDKLPILLESKYVLVPTYNFNGDVKDTSIKQEHVIGSSTYVLSLGTYNKERKLAYNNV